MYVDESGILDEYLRERAYARRGERVPAVRRGRNGKRTNVIGALCDGRHIGIECYGHATNAEFFEAWFRRLLPLLPRGCTVILDNAGFHRRKALEGIIKKSRRKIGLLFLPPYSPDYNPIEKSWANLKKHLRNYGRSFGNSHLAVENYFKVA